MVFLSIFYHNHTQTSNLLEQNFSSNNLPQHKELCQQKVTDIILGKKLRQYRRKPKMDPFSFLKLSCTYLHQTFHRIHCHETCIFQCTLPRDEPFLRGFCYLDLGTTHDCPTTWAPSVLFPLAGGPTHWDRAECSVPTTQNTRKAHLLRLATNKVS